MDGAREQQSAFYGNTHLHRPGLVCLVCGELLDTRRRSRTWHMVKANHMVSFVHLHTMPLSYATTRFVPYVDTSDPCQEDNKHLQRYYGLGRVKSGNVTKWVLSTSSLAQERTDAKLSFGLPEGWTEEHGAENSWMFKKMKNGTPVAVSCLHET